ncbi:MAG: hypothetical protein KDG51_22990, partial [Calditrichaeota bacterium]|nr:hypothetical protein [Calditrichota bacterium]
YPAVNPAGPAPMITAGELVSVRYLSIKHPCGHLTISQAMKFAHQALVDTVLFIPRDEVPATLTVFTVQY